MQRWLLGTDVDNDNDNDSSDNDSNTEMPVESTVMELGRAAVGAKKRQTRLATRILKSAPVLEGQPSNIELESMRSMYQGLCDAHEELMGVLYELSRRDTDEKRNQAWEKDQEEYTKRFDEAWNAAKKAIVRAEETLRPTLQAPIQPAVAPVAPAADRRNLPKVEAIKPFTLTTEHSFRELKTWLSQVETYFQESRLTEESFALQRAHLMRCIDSKLYADIEGLVTNDMPAIGPNSCCDLIKAEFRRLYPRFVRRQEFYKIKQKSGESFPDTIRRIKKAGEDADLADMNVDDMLVHQILRAVEDNVLKRDFMKLEDPTSAALLRLATAHAEAITKSSVSTVAEAAITSVNNKKSECAWCGGKWQDGHRAKCPAKEKKCNN